VNPGTYWLGRARRLCVIGSSIAVSLLFATVASAQIIFMVNSTDDVVDADVTDGKCEVSPPAPPGTCTLRAAVMQANRMPNAGALIKVPAGTYPLSRVHPVLSDGEDVGDLNLDVPPGYAPGPTVIAGAGAGVTIIDGLGINRILEVGLNRVVTVSGVSMVNGFAGGGDGGGILSSGSLTLNDSTIYNCSGNSGGGINAYGLLTLSRLTIDRNHANYGGGIYNGAQLTVSQSSIVGNDSVHNGGGIYSATGSTNVVQSTIAGNSAAYGGGFENDATLRVSNSTISGNLAAVDGGGIYNVASTSLFNSTVAYNGADSDADSIGIGAGLYNYNGQSFTLRNSVVAGNYLAGTQDFSDCSGAVVIRGNNRLGDNSGCSAAAGSTGLVSLINSLNELALLRYNGGPTRTVALIPPSNMINAGVLDGGCIDQNNAPLATDQRGRPRIIDAACDIGAYEYDPGDIFTSGFE
jgi:hypothetical protein